MSCCVCALVQAGPGKAHAGAETALSWRELAKLLQHATAQNSVDNMLEKFADRDALGNVRAGAAAGDAGAKASAEDDASRLHDLLRLCESELNQHDPDADGSGMERDPAAAAALQHLLEHPGLDALSAARVLVDLKQQQPVGVLEKQHAITSEAGNVMQQQK
jgi:hypothetical protein